MLSAFPNTWITEPRHYDRTAATPATPATLARAVAFIDADADLDISATDIARAAPVTVRVLQLAFRRRLDTTPMAYPRRARMDRADAQLFAANPGDGTTTVTDVAPRWGHVSPSRFCARYRDTFGQAPSDTLRS